MTKFSLSVPGIPQPQGSKRAFGRFVVETNKKLKPWRTAVTALAQEAMTGKQCFAGPVRMTVHFEFPRPKGHFGSGKNSNNLKASAPAYVAVKPDLDKLLRALGDGLCQGGVFRDDSLICAVSATKSYGGMPRTVVTVEAI